MCIFVNMKRFFPFLLLASAFGFHACDVIEGPKKDYTNVIQNSDKKVLIEDFTGHYCGNCPASHEVAHELDSIYGENLVVIAVHAGNFFGSVHPPIYMTDWRTQMGIDLDAYYNAENQGYPKGLVNRKEFNGNALVNYSNWTTYLTQVLNESPAMSIDLSSAYNAAEGTAEITVTSEYFTQGTADHNLVVVIKEDSIVAPQKNYDATPEDVLSYVHMDMLRHSVTSGTWGEALGTGTIPIGTVLTRTYTLTLDPSWVPGNCEVVAYIMDNTTKEVLQVEQVDLVAP